MKYDSCYEQTEMAKCDSYYRTDQGVIIIQHAYNCLGQVYSKKNDGSILMLVGCDFATGYFSNEEATASTLDPQGWLRTGDLCYIDEDGFIFVVDRLKELIKYKGYQVFNRNKYNHFKRSHQESRKLT